MHTTSLPISVTQNHFDHIMVTGETLGMIATLTFTDTKTSAKLCSAILLPADTELSLTYEENSAAYPIYFVEGGISVNFSFLVNNSEKILYAIIICQSPTGETRQQIHGLGHL